MTVNHLRIKAERIAKGLTQDDMAKALGWSDRARYAKRENGLVSFKRPDRNFFYRRRSLKRTKDVKKAPERERSSA